MALQLGNCQAWMETLGDQICIASDVSMQCPSHTASGKSLGSPRRWSKVIAQLCGPQFESGLPGLYMPIVRPLPEPRQRTQGHEAITASE